MASSLQMQNYVNSNIQR